MKSHGPWTIVRTKEVYRDPWLTLMTDEVIRPDGNPGTYVVAKLKPGVCVLALDDDEHVYLTEEFHYGVGRVTLEAVSGGVEPNENPLATAQRELAEEAGVTAERWTDLGVADPFTANVVSPTQLYLAQALRHVGQSLEGTEQINILKVPLRQAVTMVLESRITHAPSALLILKTHWTLSSRGHE